MTPVPRARIGPGGVTIYIYIYIYVHIYIFNISHLFWWRTLPTPLWGPGSVNHDWNMVYLYQCLGRSNLMSLCFKWIESTNGPTFSGSQKNKNNLQEQTHHWKTRIKQMENHVFANSKHTLENHINNGGHPFFLFCFCFLGEGQRMCILLFPKK